MSFVQDSLVLTQQPSYKAERSKSNEFAKHLVACVVSSSRCDVVSGKLVTTVGTVYNVPTKDGLATAASANGANHSLRGAVTGISTGNLTDFCLVRDYVGVGGSVYLYGCGTLGATGSGITLEHISASNGWAAYDSGIPGSSLAVANESIPTGLQLLMHTRNGSTHAVYRNGVLRNSVSYGNGDAVATEPWGHGSLSSGTTYSTAAKILLSGRLSKALTAEEVRRFSENPWQVLEPEDIWIWMPTGGAGVSGTSAITETRDSAASAGVVGTVGTGAGLESPDSVAGAGKIGTVGAASVAESRDIIDASGIVGASGITGTAAANEAGDVAAASGVVGTRGAGSVTETGDIVIAASADYHGFTAEQFAYLHGMFAAIPAAILAAAQDQPIHSRVKIINDTTLAGSGASGDPMRPA